MVRTRELLAPKKSSATDWSGEGGRVILLEAGHATLELFDERQAESVDRIEAGRRVSGHVRLAVALGRGLVLALRAADADHRHQRQA